MRIRMAMALFSLTGLFVALYLYLHKLGVIGVQLSPYAIFLGIPVPLLGLAGYGTLFTLSLLSLQQPAELRWSRLLFLLSGLGALFSAYLTYLELFVIHAICRWCLGSAAIILLIFLSAWLDRRAPAPERTA
jgi:uncharacterized membrane protein